MHIFTDILLQGLRLFSGFGGYGYAIILLTIAINIILYPLTRQSIVQMAALQRIQPKMQELQKKHKEEPKKMQKEIMQMYKSEKVNPLGGCLPTLLKIPFFIGLFMVLQSTPFLEILSNPMNNSSFLWISGRVSATAFQSDSLVGRMQKAKMLNIDKKASDKDGVDQFAWNFGLMVKYAVEKNGNKVEEEKTLKDILTSSDINNESSVQGIKEKLGVVMSGVSTDDTKKIIKAWSGSRSLATPDPLYLLPILIGITTYFMQKSMPTTAANSQMQMMTYMMPAFLTFICLKFPTGVQIYWLVSNSMAAIQQVYIQKKLAAKSEK
ncbi:MAG: membrane protein insertase YidC [Candidatus Saganbacteria bacterium]|nr:membrane protein insertase YidC [Candidatus Saganbacteria bacterium]